MGFKQSGGSILLSFTINEYNKIIEILCRYAKANKLKDKLLIYPRFTKNVYGIDCIEIKLFPSEAKQVIEAFVNSDNIIVTMDYSAVLRRVKESKIFENEEV